MSYNESMLWNRIEALREQLGMTRTEFAEKLGKSATHITNIERAYNVSGKMASVELIDKIADIAGANRDEKLAISRELRMEREKIVDPKGARMLGMAMSRVAMPKRFVARFKQDYENIDRPKLLSIKPFILERVFKGEVVLTRDEVVSIATEINQPVDEYLVLAGHTVRKEFDGQGMKPEFIQRVKDDLKASNRNINDIKCCTPFIFNLFLQGKSYLSKKAVMSLAKSLGQSEEEYLRVAGHMSDVVEALVQDSKLFNMFRKIVNLDENDKEQVLIFMEHVVKLHADKKGSAKSGKIKSSKS